jgi:hypothetical protein
MEIILGHSVQMFGKNEISMCTWLFAVLKAGFSTKY